MINQPEPTGEYAVGTTTFTVFNDRPETLDVLIPGTKTNANTTMRSVAVRVYYPVTKESVSGLPRARYMSREMALRVKKAYHAPLNYDKSEAKGENISDCYPDAPKIEGAKFPMIVFSHGYIAFRDSNSFLCIELASHGYVVLAVAHSLEGCLTEFDDGTSLPGPVNVLKKRMCKPYYRGLRKTFGIAKMKGSDRQIAERFDEVQKQYSKFMMSRVTEWEKDMLAAVNYAKENLSDMIDLSCGIAATGHSLGGATAYSLCLNHDEFVCGVNIDGALYGDNMGKTLTKPFLQICCKQNEWAVKRVLLDHTSPVWLASLEGMKHIGFTDMKHMIPVKMLTGKLDPDVMHRNVCSFHLEFFDAYFRGTKEHPDFKCEGPVVINEFSPDISVDRR